MRVRDREVGGAGGDRPRIRVEEAGACLEVPLGDQAITVGRHEANTLVIADPAASRHHCVIEPVPDGWQIRDLRTRNGTRLNGRPLTVAPFAPGDIATIGGTQISFVAPPPSCPTPAGAKAPTTWSSRA